MSTFRGKGVAPDGLPYVMHGFPASWFPFTITAFRADGSVAWEETVEGPGVLRVPGLGPGAVARTRIRFADGKEEWSVVRRMIDLHALIETAVVHHREIDDGAIEDWLTMEGIDPDQFKSFLAYVGEQDPRGDPDIPSLAFGFALGWISHRELGS